MSNLRNIFDRVSPTTISPVSISCSDDGTLTGNTDMVVDGSTTPIEFWVQPAVNFSLTINNVLLVLGDSGNPAFNDYGNVNSGLTNGLQLFVEIRGVRTFIISPIKNNNDIITLSGTFDINEFANGVRTIQYRDFLNNYARGIVLNGNYNEKFGCIIQDDVTNLIDHRLHVKGFTKNIKIS